MAAAQEARVLVFPLPFQGHINPMLQLADALHGRGLAVTVLHTRFNALDPAQHPDFRFVSVPYDGLPAESGTIIDVILAMNEAMEASTSVDEVLELELAAGEEQGLLRPACLFIDSNLLAMQKAATRLGLPTLVLRTGSAACMASYIAFPKLYELGYLPRQDAQLHVPVKELPPLTVRDLFFLPNISHEKVRKVLARIVEAMNGSSGVIINTFEALETDDLQKIHGELNLPILVLAVGPLHKMSSVSTGSSLLDQDYSCLEWLDAQPGKSVLYVSFGSLASMNHIEFLEVAWGLANSNQRFLWVIRPGMVTGMNGDLDLPDGFDTAVKGRGKVIHWAPQQQVLAHEAVGGFWTHNGWNSTLESISEGVPMLCRPHFADQMMNARYVEKVWGVGFELEGELERGKVEAAIRGLMSGRKAEEMRGKAEQLKMKVVDCLKPPNGSSHIAMDKLVKYILSL